jgi:predicted RNase H-like HicB family nuclease
MERTMKTYIAYVYKDPDSSFGVSFPDLPGCYGAGETYEEALESAKISLREYALAIGEDGGEMPKPRTHSELKGDASEEIEFDKAAFVAEVPLITIGGRARVNITMDDKLLAGLDRAAGLAGVTRSALLATAVKDWLQSQMGAVIVDTDRKVSAASAKRKRRLAVA